MNNKTVSNLGFIGVSLLIFTLIFGGLLIKNYDITNQFISESYAIDTKHGFFPWGFGPEGWCKFWSSPGQVQTHFSKK